MRIYNSTNSVIDLPLSSTRVRVEGKAVSKDFMPSDNFLNLVPQIYNDKQIALIVNGPFEINMCAKNPALTPLIVMSLDEAIARFNPVAEKIEEPVVVEVVKEEPVIEEVVEEPVEVKTEEPVEEEAVVEEEKPKTTKKVRRAKKN